MTVSGSIPLESRRLPTYTVDHRLALGLGRLGLVRIREPIGVHGLDHLQGRWLTWSAEITVACGNGMSRSRGRYGNSNHRRGAYASVSRAALEPVGSLEKAQLRKRPHTVGEQTLPFLDFLASLEERIGLVRGHRLTCGVCKFNRLRDDEQTKTWGQQTSQTSRACFSARSRGQRETQGLE